MIVVLMGVTGSGKTTVGKVLADQLGWSFVDADAFHPPANVAKMHRGEPLTDADRAPWLRALTERIDRARDRGESLVLACSALKHEYQDYLRHDRDDVRYACLCGPEEVIAERLSKRKGHFMDPDLLESQIELLDPPADAPRVDVSGTPEQVAREVRERLGLGG